MEFFIWCSKSQRILFGVQEQGMNFFSGKIVVNIILTMHTGISQVPYYNGPTWNPSLIAYYENDLHLVASRSRTKHLMQSPPLTIGGTVLKESDGLVTLGVTFDSKMTFEKHLRSVSRAASHRLDILRKSWRVFHDRSLLVRFFRVLSCPFWSTVQQCG